MKSLNGLSTVVKYCPECGERKTVNYWAHSEDTQIKRYQCGECSNQVPDFTRMSIGPESYVRKLAGITSLSRDEYIFRFGDTICKTEDGFEPLFRLLE